MKYKTTKRAVMDGYDFVISVGYADLQHLLYYKSPVAYTSGQYGWNADIYDFWNIAICTGYRPFGNISSSKYGINRMFDKTAEEVWGDCNLSYDDKVKRLDSMSRTYVDYIVRTHRLANQKRRANNNG